MLEEIDIFYFLIQLLIFMCLSYLFLKTFAYSINKIKLSFIAIFSTFIYLFFCFYFHSLFLFGSITFLLLTIIFYLQTHDNLLQISFNSSLITIIYNLVFVIVSVFYRSNNSIIDTNDITVVVFSWIGTLMIISIFYNSCFGIFIIKSKNTIYYSTYALIMLFIELCSIATISSLKDLSFYHILNLFLIGMLCFLGLVIVAILNTTTKQLEVTKQNNLSKTFLKLYYQKIKDDQEYLSKIRHDYNNQLIVLQQLLIQNNISKSLDYISSLTDKILEKKTNIYTKNVLIDAYINYLIQTYSDFNFLIRSNDLSVNEDMSGDLLLVIMNLINNAIENSDENKNIVAELLFETKQYIIKVENSCHEDPNLYNFKTRKKDQLNHGYGLEIVKDIVAKYHGTYLTDYHDNIFKTYIVLYKDEM